MDAIDGADLARDVGWVFLPDAAVDATAYDRSLGTDPSGTPSTKTFVTAAGVDDQQQAPARWARRGRAWMDPPCGRPRSGCP